MEPLTSTPCAGRTIPLACAVLLLASACEDDDGPGVDAAIDAGTDAGPRPDAGPLPGAVFDTSTTWKADPLSCP